MVGRVWPRHSGCGWPLNSVVRRHERDVMPQANCPKCSTIFDSADNRTSDNLRVKCPKCAFEFQSHSRWFSAAPDAPFKQRLLAGAVAGIAAAIVAALVVILRR